MALAGLMILWAQAAKGCVGFGQIGPEKHWVLFGEPLMKLPMGPRGCPAGFQIGKQAPPPKPPQRA